MKIYIRHYFLLLLALGSWHYAKGDVIICGTIEDDNRADVIEISNTIDYFFDHGYTQSATLDSGGYFHFKLQVKHPKFVFLRYKNGIKRIFVHDNDSLYAKLEAKDHLYRITFSGEGAAENNFLNLFDHNYEKISPTKRLKNVLQKTEDYRKARINFINDHKAQYELSEAFVQTLTYDVKYSSIVGLSLFFQRDDIDKDVRANFYKKAMLSEKVNNDSAIASTAYHEYLYHYQVFYKLKFLNEAKQLLEKDKNSLSEAREIIIYKSFEGKTLERALVSLMLQALRHNESKAVVDGFYERFTSKFPDSRFNALITERLKESFSANRHKKAVIVNNEGNINDSNPTFAELIKPYKGKVIYIDFWATWCSPCLAEFRHVAELKDQFRGNDDLLFMYISLDNKAKIDKWKKFVHNYKLDGVNILLPGGTNSRIARQLNIQGIPRYVIVDKNGNIAVENALRPSRKKRLYDQIRSFL